MKKIFLWYKRSNKKYYERFINLKSLNPILISGKEVLPLIEGGKGINGSDGRSSGAWAHENCVGTFSGVSPDFYDDKGNVIIEKFLKNHVPNVMKKW